MGKYIIKLWSKTSKLGDYLEDQKEDNLKVWSEFNKLRIQFKGGIL
jgi:hypothetical protein